MKSHGFTLIELLIVVAILGILSAIGIPMYVGYVDNSRVTVAQNGLRAVYAQQQEYFSNNNVYYSTGATGDASTDATATINTNLFAGRQVLDNSFFGYCILQTTTGDFTVQADETSGARLYSVDENSNANF